MADSATALSRNLRRAAWGHVSALSSPAAHFASHAAITSFASGTMLPSSSNSLNWGRATDTRSSSELVLMLYLEVMVKSSISCLTVTIQTIKCVHEKGSGHASGCNAAVVSGQFVLTLLGHAVKTFLETGPSSCRLVHLNIEHAVLSGIQTPNAWLAASRSLDACTDYCIVSICICGLLQLVTVIPIARYAPIATKCKDDSALWHA